MKLLFFIYLSVLIVNSYRVNTETDILDKLDDVLDDRKNNELFSDEDLTNSIIDLLDKDDGTFLIGNKNNNSLNFNNLLGGFNSNKETLNITNVNTSTPVVVNQINTNYFKPKDNNVEQSLGMDDTINFIMKKNKLKLSEMNRSTENNLFSNNRIDQTGAIFDHLYINSNGDKHFPNGVGWIYDPMDNNFIVTEESKKYFNFLVNKEDDITKLMRIESILDTMNFYDDVDEHKLPTFQNPPIISGLENQLKKLDTVNLRLRDKIKTEVIKKKKLDDYFRPIVLSNITIPTIRSPPNFLY